MAVDAPRGQGQQRIHRHGLSQWIDAALASGSLLVVAGAGFGKTTAVDAALADHGRLATWIVCTEADHEAGHLLTRILEGVRIAAPGVIDVLADGIAASRRAVDVQEVLPELAAELRRLLPSPLTIVFDDAERLAGARDSVALVAELIAADTGAATVVVVSRCELPLRVARLRARGAVTVLGAQDLAFSPPECAALLRLRGGREASMGEVDGVFTATEGWPLGVALAARTGVAGRLAAPASAGTLLAFLDEEVLDRLTPDVRDAVVDSAIVARLSPAAVEALGLPGDFIGRLEAMGLGLRTVGPDTRTAAHHPLVRELLLERLVALRSPERRRAMHALVAPVVAREGDADAAVEHWLVAEAWPEATAAVATRGQALAAIAPSTVRRWLRALPAPSREEPSCLLLSGTLEWAAGDNAKAIELLRAAVRGFDDRGDAVGAWFARFALADPLSIVGAWEETVALARGFEQAPPGAAQAVAAIVGAYAATALGATGQIAECEAMSARLLAHPGAARRLRGAQAVWELYMRSLSGDYDETIVLFERKLAELERPGFLSRRPLIATGLALSLGELGRDEEALDAWQRTSEIAQRFHMVFLVDWACAWRSVILARAGRLTEAEAELATARVGASSGWRDFVFHLARARIAALQGRHGAACSAAENAVVAAAAAPLADRLRLVVEVAPLLHAAHQGPRAHELVTEALALCDARVAGRPGDHLRSLLLGAYAHLLAADGDEHAASLALQRAWACAGANVPAMVRSQWPTLQPLVWAALASGHLEVEAAVDALAEAAPGGEHLLAFTAHPLPAVRRVALLGAGVSGHPDVARRVGELRDDPDTRVAATARDVMRRTSQPPPLRFVLLGGFALQRGRHMVKDAAWQRRGAQRLVRLLLVHSPAPMSEDELFVAFWPQAAPPQARRSLQVAISCARAVLDTPGAPSVIDVAQRTVRLRLRDGDCLDTQRFESAARAALDATASGEHDLLVRASDLWTGEPLPEDRYADWALSWRARLTDRFGQVLTALIRVHGARGDHPSAILTARRLVELDELDEGAQRALIGSYLAAGRRAHALRQYLECRRVLGVELGIEPSAQTVELQRLALTGEWRS